jgi:alpha/beta superfamily hydrolase
MPLSATLEQAIVSEDIRFQAGPYLLHGELAYPEAGRATGAVVLAGPHPLLGGNMRNNVVCRLGEGLAQQGMLTLRFDYRGVGQSEGPRVNTAGHLAEFWRTSHVPGEIDFWRDLQAAVELVRLAVPGLPLALVGYSFGCALLPYVQPRNDLTALVLIAPTVARHDYGSFLSVQCPLLVVASEDDFAADARQVDSWLDTLVMPRQMVRRQCDNHFFRGHEDWLLETLCRFLDGHTRSREPSETCCSGDDDR